MVRSVQGEFLDEGEEEEEDDDEEDDDDDLEHYSDGGAEESWGVEGVDFEVHEYNSGLLSCCLDLGSI